MVADTGDVDHGKKLPTIPGASRTDCPPSIVTVVSSQATS